MGVEVDVVADKSRVRPWEIWHLQSDNTKLWQAIGFKMLTALRPAIEKTVQYFRDNGNKWDW